MSEDQNRDRPPSNIEFRDASNSILFVEHLSSDYPLEDVFYQYFPDAPQALLFYVFGDVALPKQSTLSDIFSEFTIQELPVVVWVKMPVPYAPGLSPKWK
ncbi:hypothetical protein FB639_006605 [Coemansia asiatica]|nr:hypothetical protein FB639_006605 [Coemansia asiatica]